MPKERDAVENIISHTVGEWGVKRKDVRPKNCERERIQVKSPWGAEEVTEGGTLQKVSAIKEVLKGPSTIPNKEVLQD